MRRGVSVGLVVGSAAVLTLALTSSAVTRSSAGNDEVAPVSPVFGSVTAPGAQVAPDAILSVPPAVERTPEQMRADASRPAPRLPDHAFINRPTTDMADYFAFKAAAARERSPAGRSGVTPSAPPAAPPSVIVKNFNGSSENGLIPPDTHGASGKVHYGEITNSQIQFFSRTDGSSVRLQSLASFFGYFATTIFDPRLIYDLTWNRWVIFAESFPESATVQRVFLAVSTTANALGSYHVYSFDINIFDNDDFFDFPDLGHDQDALIITWNNFGPVFFRDARMMAIAKARVYNGLGFNVPVFTGLIGTVAPPVVLDQNAESYLIAAPNNGNALKLYTLRNGSRAFEATLSAPVNVAVGAYTVPAEALQPPPCTGDANTLDTADNRFVNASTQNGNFLFNVHTVNFGGFATVRWYQVNTAANSLVTSDDVFASASSHDFNASILANNSNDLFVTWSSTDPANAINAQVRFSGRRATDPADIPAGSALFTSPTCITGNFDPDKGNQRWGDYSAVSQEPFNQSHAWIVNEKINSQFSWGSRIGRIRF